MTPSLSQNTQAILLLTAPLIVGGGGQGSGELLSPGEYRKLAVGLHTRKRQPADLLGPEIRELLDACGATVERGRLERLLARGFLLSQAVERWHQRGIWVVSRADPEYPATLRRRLREAAPPVLYGSGHAKLLTTGGLAVVGSRNADASLLTWTEGVARLAAGAGYTVVSGGARGVDQAAMRGALHADGAVVGVLADSLEQAAIRREYRDAFRQGRLVLVSPYDPAARFLGGHAMARNKVVYALSEAALVVESDVGKGGTWTGAVEQLEKLRLVPLFVRSSGAPSAGLDALRRKGALPWPNPAVASDLAGVFGSPAPAPRAEFQDLPLRLSDSSRVEEKGPSLDDEVSLPVVSEPPAPTRTEPAPTPVAPSPAEELVATVRKLFKTLLATPRPDAELAAELGVTVPQARAWLTRLVDEGLLERSRKPKGYVVAGQGLLPSLPPASPRPRKRPRKAQ